MTNAKSWQLANADERDLRRLAELIALKLKAGDVIALEGDLGAGKTTFARHLIRAVLSDPEHEVPSPTFGLIQTYSAQRIELSHLDLYRLNEPDELVELGIDELLSDGVVIVEWPDRLDETLSLSTLTIAISDGHRGEHRNIIVSGEGTWPDRIVRLMEINAFLNAQDAWSSASISYMQGDASARSYAKLDGGPKPALLMDAPAQPDGPVIRNGKSYSQLVGLAETVVPFVAIAGSLRDMGVSAPAIYGADLKRGLLILEYLGEPAFGAALTDGFDQQTLWRAAVDVLIMLHQDIADQTWDFETGETYRLPVMNAQVLATEARLLLDWYWPHVKGVDATDDVYASFDAATKPLFQTASRAARHWVLRDFHSPNLIWRKDKAGLDRVGVIDFQDALRGPPEYDLVSLLQDARVDVPAQIADDLLSYYITEMEHAAHHDDTIIFDRHETLLRYSILGAQRAIKILGIFARLANRDGKPQYLAHLPRLWRYLNRNLEHSELHVLRQWFALHFSDNIKPSS